MAKRIKPLAYDADGYSHVCKSCLARGIAEDATASLDRTLRHLFRDAESAIRNSCDPLAVKVRKRAGLELRREKIDAAIDGLLGAMYDMWAELETEADHERATVSAFRKARQHGARKMREQSPKAQADAAAKAAARTLWPAASRKGWTAAQFHKELTDSGHAVPFDTSRKWLTKLRKTGTC